MNYQSMHKNNNKNSMSSHKKLNKKSLYSKISFFDSYLTNLNKNSDNK